MLSKKYGRTYHYPFSPGTPSDDRINHTYWEDIQQIATLIARWQKYRSVNHNDTQQ